MSYAPKALMKTFVKPKVAEFIDTVDLRYLTDRCYFCDCNLYLSLPVSSPFTPFMATERSHEPGTQKEVAKVLGGREKEERSLINFHFFFT